MAKTLTGEGKVYRGENEIATARYTLTLTPGNQNQLGGRITIITGEWNFTPNEVLILHLKDGRQLDFISNPSGDITSPKTYTIRPAGNGRPFSF